MRRLLLAIILLLAACARVPTSGPIVEVDQPVTDTANNSFVRVLARPPQPGMSQTEIVQGFLDAASGFEDDHAVAKEYLTTEEAARWNPTTGTRVYGNDTQTLAQPSETTVLLTASQVGLISDRSQYVQSPPASLMEVEFELQKDGADWRISRAPQGLLLSRAAVERSFREFNTYYVARPGGILAPNSILFQSSKPDIVSDLVKELVAGPSRWLAPSVINAFPVGTTVRSVTVTDGVAFVDLSSQVQDADGVARQQLSAQVVWTLRQIASIRAVTIASEGQPLAIPGVPNPVPRTAWADYDPDGLAGAVNYYLIRGGRVYSVDTANTATQVPGAPGIADPPVSDPLISMDQTAAAVTDDTGRLLTAQLETDSKWRDGPLMASRGGSWDRTGLLWLPVGGAVKVVNVLGEREVACSLSDISSVQVSRDGSRATVISAGRAYLLRVDRSSDTPALVGPRLLSDIPLRAAAWLNANTMVLLTRAKEQPAQVATVELGLYTVRYLGGPPQARTVAAAPDLAVLSGTADGQIWAFNGATWVPVLEGRQPRYPG